MKIKTTEMAGQSLNFVVSKKKGIVTGIGKSTMSQPKVKFRGGKIHWYEDRVKPNA